jgi:cytochrome c peroxidase
VSSPWIAVALLVTVLVAPGQARADPDAVPSQRLGVAAAIDPPDNPRTQAKVALGRRLFFDKRLSRDSSISCATCHDPNAAFADPHARSAGTRGRQTRRHSPSVLNVHLFEALGHLMWDGRAATLEQQVLLPFDEESEFDLPVQEAVRRLQRYGYGPAFEAAFGSEVSSEGIAKAIAAYERTLFAGASPFDRFLLGREEDAIPEEAKRGFRIFLGSRCNACHLIDARELHPFSLSYVSFTDGRFHNIGIGADASGAMLDPGRFEVTGDPADVGRFKTPSLRNVAMTAPYFHDGSAATLEEVVEVYNKGGIANANLDPALRPLELDPRAKRDLVAFLHSLTSPRAAELADEESRIGDSIVAGR